jgi:hypothetical protein
MDPKLIRAQMKSKISSGEKLSGKDKAKLLKSLRDREKNQENGPVSVDQAGQVEESHPVIVSSTEMTDSIESTTEKKSAEIPQGFFDNEKEEMLAKGLDVSQEIKKQEGSANEVLHSFFEEVDNLVPDESLEDVDGEEQESDLIEDAVQLAYSAKIGNLMLRCDPSNKREGKQIDKEIEDAAREASEILGQDHEFEETSLATDGEAIQRIVGTTLAAKKKRKLESAKYEPIDLMDWTSRAIRRGS